MIKLNWFKLDESAKLPKKQHLDDAGFDFYSLEDKTIPANGSSIIKTGIGWNPEFNCNKFFRFVLNKLFVPYMQIKSRSGLGIKKGIELTNAGVIDKNYTGEIIIKLYNNNDLCYKIIKGDRIAQGVVLISPRCLSNEINKSDIVETERKGGLGSTGK